MKFTLGQAAKETGVSKSTLSRALDSGKISGERQPDNSWQIDASELFRVYPRLADKPAATRPGGAAGNDPQSPGTGVATASLQAEVERLRELLSNLNIERDRERSQLVDQIEDLRLRLDGETAERRELMRRLLTDQRKADSPPAPPDGAPPPSGDAMPPSGSSVASRRGLWSWLGRSSA